MKWKGKIVQLAEGCLRAGGKPKAAVVAHGIGLSEGWHFPTGALTRFSNLRF
jgi:hypothetical protein